ncbi:MAG: PAS domain S-box protein [Gammaproteobacteria bacterium]|nr:PAS domain S-box protein [Gammaproteobacteria bacterium]
MNFAASDARPGELQALLDAAVDAVLVIDHLGRIQRFNQSAERLFGYPAEEVLGRNVSMLMTEKDRLTHDAHLARYLSTQVPHIIGKGREVKAQRRNGSVFSAWLSVGVVAGEDSPRYVGVIQDLTLRRGAEEQARGLQERLWHVSRLTLVGEMASGISHELNQPLAAIANYAQACERLLVQPNADLEEIRGALRQIGSQALRAGDIIRRLRSLTNHRDGAREPTDVNLLIRELSDLVQADAQRHDVQYLLDLETGLPSLEVNRTQIQQVILNLVRNALEALADTPGERRQLRLRTCRADDGVEISVCDSGPGLSPAVLSRLFEPFCTSKPAGTGLGLAISRTIVGQHQGTLNHRANTPSGACFVVQLPWRAEASS